MYRQENSQDTEAREKAEEEDDKQGRDDGRGLERVYTRYGTVHTREAPPHSHSTEHTHVQPNTDTVGVYKVHTQNVICAHSASSAEPHPPSKPGKGGLGGRPECKIILKLLKIYLLYRKYKPAIDFGCKSEGMPVEGQL
jgi:hypothetical protein